MDMDSKDLNICKKKIKNLRYEADNPEWLPATWTTEKRIRICGLQVGKIDKYYIEGATGNVFRSKAEVMHYLNTGFRKKKQKKMNCKELNAGSANSNPHAEHTILTKGQLVSKIWLSNLSCKWVLCGSALDINQKEQLNNFANLIGATITKTWSSSVTHVIVSTDANGACRRTVKFLMAILEGKWVLKTDWVAACIKAGHPVKEDEFEISHDIYDSYGGPKQGRQRVEKKAPRLFEGLNFCLSGDFSASSKGYLQDLVSAGGGVVLHSKPIMDQPDCLRTIVLYNVELAEMGDYNDEDKEVQRRLNEAKTLAHALGAQLAAHTWVFESIAACQLQPAYNTDSCASST